MAGDCNSWSDASMHVIAAGAAADVGGAEGKRKDGWPVPGGSGLAAQGAEWGWPNVWRRGRPGSAMANKGVVDAENEWSETPRSQAGPFTSMFSLRQGVQGRPKGGSGEANGLSE